MAADDAFVVAQPSTPASYFHLLRRHALGDEHRPLIVFTPKSMLRRKEAASQPDDFTEGTFRPLIADEVADPAKVRHAAAVQRPDHLGPDGRARASSRATRRRPRSRGSSSSTRDPSDELEAEIERFPNLERRPLGAGRAGQHGPGPAPAAEPVRRARPAEVEVISRPASSSPSVGQHSRHVEELKGLMSAAFEPSRQAEETTEPAVYFTDRGDRGARSADGATRRSRWPGSPSGSRSSPTCTRSSRRRSSGSPPGWPGSTTPTTTEPQHGCHAITVER